MLRKKKLPFIQFHFIKLKNWQAILMPFATTGMQLEIIILCEVSQRKTYIIWYHLYVESMTQMNLSMKQK